MDETELFESALRQFADLEPDLRKLIDSAWSGDLGSRMLERARLAWCELRALRTHPLGRGHQDAYVLGSLEEAVATHLHVLAVACRLPLWLLLQGDGGAWELLSEELARLTGSRLDQQRGADTREDKTSRKLPSNPDVMRCIRYLQQRGRDRVPRRQQIVDFIAETGLNRRCQLQNLERQVRRFSWLLNYS